VDARYAGQSYELTVDADGWVDRFHEAHHARFGYSREGAVVEAVTLRVEAVAPAPDAAFPVLPPAIDERPVPHGTQRVRQGGVLLETPLFERTDLLAGHRIEGPAIVSEYTATLWVPPGWTVVTQDDGSLSMQHAASPGTRSPAPASVDAVAADGGESRPLHIGSTRG
jgi:N-methylhydantoinase A/oxoprolinase/acetone carboxylase beta subunit